MGLKNTKLMNKKNTVRVNRLDCFDTTTSHFSLSLDTCPCGQRLRAQKKTPEAESVILFYK